MLSHDIFESLCLVELKVTNTNVGIYQKAQVNIWRFLPGLPYQPPGHAVGFLCIGLADMTVVATDVSFSPLCNFTVLNIHIIERHHVLLEHFISLVLTCANMRLFRSRNIFCFCVKLCSPLHRLPDFKACWEARWSMWTEHFTCRYPSDPHSYATFAGQGIHRMSAGCVWVLLLCTLVVLTIWSADTSPLWDNVCIDTLRANTALCFLKL